MMWIGLNCQFCAFRVILHRPTEIVRVKVDGGWNYYVLCKKHKEEE